MNVFHFCSEMNINQSKHKEGLKFISSLCEQPLLFLITLSWMHASTKSDLKANEMRCVEEWEGFRLTIVFMCIEGIKLQIIQVYDGCGWIWPVQGLTGSGGWIYLSIKDQNMRNKRIISTLITMWKPNINIETSWALKWKDCSINSCSKIWSDIDAALLCLHSTV